MSTPRKCVIFAGLAAAPTIAINVWTNPSETIQMS